MQDYCSTCLSYQSSPNVQMKNSLAILRATYRWSQADLGDKLDVSRQTINAIETSKYDPSLPLAFKIAKLFNKNIEEIFDFEDNSLFNK